MSNQEIIFMCGLPASGKTTLSKAYAKEYPEYVRIGADDIRKELYGSTDRYGDGDEVYKAVLREMKYHLDNGDSIIYDAVNMNKDWRIDFFNDLLNQYPDVEKSIAVVSTSAKECRTRFFERNQQERKLNFEHVKHYFYPKHSHTPKKNEGWDNIYTCCSKAYIASPFFAPEHRKAAIEAAEIMRAKGIDPYLPLETKIENAWDYPNHEWGRMVFENDVKAIQECDTVIMLSYGRMGSAGTAWEAGYAYGLGKRVIVVQMPEVELMSLMVANGRYATVNGLKELKEYDFFRMPQLRDNEMEQK